MSLYWVARLPSKRTKADRSALASVVPNSNRRHQRIALSLAIVGAVAAPFVFRTYKARPTYAVWLPLTAQEKENLAVHLQNYCRRETGDIARDVICSLGRKEYEQGGKYESYPDLMKYLALNVSVAAAALVSVFGLAFLIPMLARGFAFLIQRYWKWLNA